VFSPLNGMTKVMQIHFALSYEYYVKVVPTEFKDEHGLTQTINQFSATSNEMVYRGSRSEAVEHVSQDHYPI
jgi:hypothetical protein